MFWVGECGEGVERKLFECIRGLDVLVVLNLKNASAIVNRGENLEHESSRKRTCSKKARSDSTIILQKDAMLGLTMEDLIP